MKILTFFICFLFFCYKGFTQTPDIIVCPGQEVALIAAKPDGENYQWQYSFDNFQWYDIPGATDTIHYVYPLQSTFYKLKVTSEDCEFELFTQEKYVLVDNTLESPGLISGNSTICSESDETYYISAVPGALDYNWSYSGTGTISGSDSSITLNATSSGTLSVYVSNYCATSSTQTISITVNQPPNQPGAISGNQSPDPNENNVLYSIPPAIGADTYLWTVPPDATITNGQGSTAIVVNFGTTDGQICVTAENSCGESKYSCMYIIMDTDPQNLICLNATQTQVVDVINPITGKTWMDRNLGAHRAGQSINDYHAYGCLYQWGRPSDGHELIKWQSATTGTAVYGSTSIYSTSDVPGHNLFILSNSSPFDWRTPQNNSLWQGENGINNPCPSGYRLPTIVELNAERNSWNQYNTTGAYNSQLKMMRSGTRFYTDGAINDIGEWGRFWSSTTSTSNTMLLRVSPTNVMSVPAQRAGAASVRCIKDFHF